MDLGTARCVVTGATEGIGRAIAVALGKRGARVAICSRTATRVDETLHQLKDDGIAAVGQACDVSSPESVARFARFVAAELGAPDVLINNAGVGHMAPLDQLTLQQFDETFAVNVRGIFLVTRAFLPTMLERRSGHIVNIASLAGRNGFVGGTAYTASKHAVLGLSKSLMLEVRDRNVRVIAICPGSVSTGFSSKASMRPGTSDRVLWPEDVAHAVVATLELPDHAMISELDIRPTNP